ncbi:glucose dehydrogenase [FAD, quinone] [Coccinella septempunctata]|uniref:glucose dehydrogenase [FAD, quinone] n=1 Tax=Coccinella septempunctata TaxID=41139 RepID=UPI001D06C1AC|nr:glucose dehydrogenase [FAD, quinone] [Coccinella septempunctata]
MGIVPFPVVAGAFKSAVGILGIGAASLAIFPLLPFIFASLAYFHYDQFDPENRIVDTKQLLHTYDFIVVGAGSAGSVVTNRLTENPNWNVLLIEAGGHENEITDVPILSLYLHKSKVDWGYKTEPQPTACQAMIENRCSWTRGKILGGSSVLNTMLYVRGNRRDYDHWVEQGNPGWSYEEVLPYFKKSEDQRNPYLAKNTKYHATGGYQTVQDAPYNTPLGPAFIEAGQEMGYDIRDINGEKQTGFAFYQFTMRRNARCSTSKAFLRPIRLRKNFHVSLWSHVTRVLIDPASKRAYGVEFFKNGKYYRVMARKEVILSAGAINSPHILMLSGIGPAKHLQEKGIRVIRDAPGVGQNLQDHIAVGGLTFLIDPKVAIVMNRLVNINSALRYAIQENGPLTSSIGLEAVGFISTKYANQTDDWPDIEFMLTSASVNADGGQQVARAHGLTDEFYKEIYEPVNYKDSFSVFPMMLRPKSRGEIKLRSKDPFDYPLLYHNYLTHPHDVDVLREGLKAAIAYGYTDTFKKFGARLHNPPLPNCKHLPMHTDEYWNCAIRQYTLSIYHYSCTAKMGPRDDPMAVVDPELRVYGVPGLRVIDASIMPTITNGNINAPVIMIGEKGADMVKNYWLRRSFGGRRKKEARSSNVNSTIF